MGISTVASPFASVVISASKKAVVAKTSRSDTACAIACDGSSSGAPVAGAPGPRARREASLGLAFMGASALRSSARSAMGSAGLAARSSISSPKPPPEPRP